MSTVGSRRPWSVYRTSAVNVNHQTSLTTSSTSCSDLISVCSSSAPDATCTKVGRSVTCLSSHATHHARNTPFSHGEPEPVLSLQLAAEPCRMQLAARLVDNIFELDGAQRTQNSANASKLNQSDLGFEIEQYCYVRITPDSDADICRIASKTLWRQSFRRVS